MKTAPAKVRWPRLKRRWFRPRVFAIALMAAVPVGLLVVWITTALVASSALRKAERDADRLDPGWRFDDLIARRAIVPDDENSAMQVRTALTHLPGGFPINVKRVRLPDGTLPPVKKDLHLRLEEFAAWDRLDDALAAEVRRQLRTVGQGVIEGRKISGMPRGRQDPKYAKLLWSTLLPYVQNSRSVYRLMAADAVLRAHDGDPDGALESCRACMNVGRSIGDQPFMISQLVRVACVGQALWAAERVLNQGEPSGAAMAKLQALLLDEADQPLALMGLRGERAMIDNTFGLLASGEVTFREVQGAAGNPRSTTTGYLASASGAFIRYNHGLALGRMNEAIEIANRPYYEQPALWNDSERRSQPSDSLVAQLASSLSRETLPSIGDFNNQTVRIRAQLFAMATLLAAERHRLAHGAFPASIEAIDAKFLPRGLIDPFSGKPLCFKSDGEGGLIVYSVGFDRRDDGGEKLGVKNWIQKGHDVGYRLHAPKGRGRPPRVATLPEDVFRDEPKRDHDEIEGP